MATSSQNESLAPDGTELSLDYWQKIMPAVNKCGDSMLDIWRDYKWDYPFTTTKVERCGDRLKSLHKLYGDVPFAVNVVIFFENLHGEEVSPFNANIMALHDTMPEQLLITVERLRYLNTKLQSKIKEITGQLK